MGVVGLLGVTLFLRLSGSIPANQAAGILPVVLAMLALGELPIYFIVRKTFVARAVADRRGSLEILKQGLIPLPLQSLAILGAALVEGVGLLGTVTVMLGGPWYVLAAPVLAIALILLQIPTRAKLERLVREA